MFLLCLCLKHNLRSIKQLWRSSRIPCLILGLFLVEGILNTVSMALRVIHMFKLLMWSWLNIRRSHIPRNLSIFFRFSSLVKYRFLNCVLMILWIFSVSVLMFFFCSLILLFWIFSLCLLVSFAKFCFYRFYWSLLKNKSSFHLSLWCLLLYWFQLWHVFVYYHQLPLDMFFLFLI